jgi:hypothetical protein
VLAQEEYLFVNLSDLLSIDAGCKGSIKARKVRTESGGGGQSIDGILNCGDFRDNEFGTFESCSTAAVVPVVVAARNAIAAAHCDKAEAVPILFWLEFITMSVR